METVSSHDMGLNRAHEKVSDIVKNAPNDGSIRLIRTWITASGGWKMTNAS